MRKDEHQDAKKKKKKSQVRHGITFFLNGNIQEEILTFSFSEKCLMSAGI